MPAARPRGENGFYFYVLVIKCSMPLFSSTLLASFMFEGRGTKFVHAIVSNSGRESSPWNVLRQSLQRLQYAEN